MNKLKILLAGAVVVFVAVTMVLAQEKVPIIVYGSSECHHCLDFKKELDQHKLTYTFHDLETDTVGEREMLNKVRAIGYVGTIHLPVVCVGDSLFMRPELEKVTETLKVIKGK